ncbi:hypothetical protein [Kitasatospora phosalacinea]|uniref:Uncharacterized protein n=1 Tax=Kitasatospora phosalacinea TaxID=2065 RepID=A0ABW6GT88_9ACTN
MTPAAADPSRVSPEDLRAAADLLRRHLAAAVPGGAVTPERDCFRTVPADAQYDFAAEPAAD